MQLIEKRQKSAFVGKTFKGLGFWTYNVYMVMINGRGSVESISLVLLTGMLYNLMKFREIVTENDENPYFYDLSLKNFIKSEGDKHLLKAALFYSGLVTFRLYPILYGFSVVLFIQRGKWMPTNSTIKFFIISAGLFVFLFGLSYALYGNLFVYEWALYHLVRKDPRHSQSVFWMRQMYNMVNGDKIPINLITLVFRLGTIVWVSFKFRSNIVLAIFINTLIFTVFNTVYTAQYAIWEIQLLPLLFKQTTLWTKSKLKFFFVMVFWLLTMELSIIYGGMYENGGKNTLYKMHISNIVYVFYRIFVVKFVLDNRIPYLDY